MAKRKSPRATTATERSLQDAARVLEQARRQFYKLGQDRDKLRGFVEDASEILEDLDQAETDFTSGIELLEHALDRMSQHL